MIIHATRKLAVRLPKVSKESINPGGDGNPIEVMDLGLALQTLSLECIALGAQPLNNGPQSVPHDIEQATLHAALQEWVN